MDVARNAGVSQATVSQVLNESPEHPSRVSAETRQRILAAAERLGYAANPVAQSLKGGRNFLLGFHTFERVFPTDQTDFYFAFLLGVESEATSQGYDLLLVSPSADGRDGGTRRSGRLRVADGCVLLGRHIDRDELAHLARDNYPFVCIGRREVPGVEVAYVGADYAAATKIEVVDLATRGHRAIGYIGEPGGGEQSEDRLAGFWSGVGDAGLDESGCPKHGAPLTPVELKRWVIDRGVTAVLVEPGDDDSNSAALERVAAEVGLRIPEDLSVVVLGDPPQVQSTLEWTGYSVPAAEIGRESVRLLVDLLDGDDPARQVTVPCERVVGATVAAPRSGAWEPVDP